MFKVAIIGGENLGNYKLFAEKCVYFLKNKTKNGITILSTGDKYVNVFAKATNIDVKQYNYKNPICFSLNDYILNIIF